LDPDAALTEAATLMSLHAKTLESLLKEASKAERADQREGMMLSVMSVLLFRKSQRSNFMQRKLSLYLLFTRCPKAVFSLLHRCGVSLSYEGSLNALKGTSKRALEKLEKWKAQGRLMAVADNINLTIGQTTINATIGHILALRVPNLTEKTPEKLAPQRPPTSLPSTFVHHTPEEVSEMREVLTIMVGRVLVAHNPALAPLKGWVNSPIEHAQSAFTKLRTEECGTEILFLDENKSVDIPQILDYFAVSPFFSLFPPLPALHSLKALTFFASTRNTRRKEKRRRRRRRRKDKKEK